MARMERGQIADLVRKAQKGEVEAMNRLLEAAYKNVLFQCRRIMDHPEDAEDMAQEALLKIYEKLDTLREPERFISWANTIASRLCLNERQRNPKDLQFLEDEEGNSVLDNLVDIDLHNVPEAAMDSAETQHMVQELVDKLPPEQRKTVMLYYNAEMSIKEIAQRMDVSENTVKSRLNYGRRALEKGVKSYEKEGVKLYGLAPMPFLLYFLRSAAETGGDAAAAAAVKTVLSSAGGAGVAAGTAAGSTAAAGASAGAASAGAGILSGLGVKIAAAIVAGAVAIGGGAAIINGLSEEEQVDEIPPEQSQQITEPEDYEAAEVADPSAPVPIASYTTRRTTVLDERQWQYEIYLETPGFEEVNQGYAQINAFLDQIHQSFNAEDDPMVAAQMEEYNSGAVMARYVKTCGVVYQDEYYLSLSFSVPPTSDERSDYTFDVRTGQLLELSDLCEDTGQQAADWVAEAIRNSTFGEYLTQENYPDGEEGFYLANSDLTMEDIWLEGETASSNDGGPHKRCQAIYTWHMDDTVDDVNIPLPAMASMGEMLPIGG